jgi:hypothetical protein
MTNHVSGIAAQLENHVSRRARDEMPNAARMSGVQKERKKLRRFAAPLAVAINCRVNC